MRFLVICGVLLSVVGWLAMGCQSSPATSSTPLPTATLIADHSRTPTSTATLTLTPTPVTPTPVPGPLTEAEAIGLLKEELAARGVALGTLRIRIAGEPRCVSIRYASAYDVDSSVFHAQTVLVALAAARVVVRVRPPMNGGIRVAVIPGGESNIGLKVTTMDGSSLEAWANGAMSDEEFVGEWTVGIVTRE